MFPCNNIVHNTRQNVVQGLLADSGVEKNWKRRIYDWCFYEPWFARVCERGNRKNPTAVVQDSHKLSRLVSRPHIARTKVGTVAPRTMAPDEEDRRAKRAKIDEAEAPPLGPSAEEGGAADPPLVMSDTVARFLAEIVDGIAVALSADYDGEMVLFSRFVDI